MASERAANGPPARYAFVTGMAFGAPAVDPLCADGIPPALLVGYPEQLSHRSGYAPLADLATRHAIPLIETSDINDGRVHREVVARGVDLLVVAGWSQLIRPPLLTAGRLGAIGMHPTRLPHGRGRAPIPWTIIKGITSTAVTLFFLNERADAGDIIAQVEFPISRRADAAAVYRRVTGITVDLLRQYLPQLLAGKAPRRAQPDGGSQWPLRRPDGGLIDWQRPATELYDWIRALSDPYPGAFTTAGGRRLYVHSADLLDGQFDSNAPTGALVAAVWSTRDGGLLAQCGKGLLVLREVQWAGGPRRDALALLEAGELAVGTRLGWDG